MRIHIGHTPDADDAFMFYAMLNNKIDCEGLTFDDTLEPITNLNTKAVQAFYDMTAISVGYLSQIADKYDILMSGACMAEERGPLFVARKNAKPHDIAVPGLNTTAYFAVRLFNKDLTCHVLPFDQILSAIQKGLIDGGVLISEDQLRVDRTMYECIDLGLWWNNKTGYPLPLGVDGVRKDLPIEIKQKIHSVFKRSICYAREHEREAINWAIRFARGLNIDDGLSFVRTFVNDFTVDMGERGKKSLQCFLDACFDTGLIEDKVTLTFTDGEHVAVKK